MECSAFDSGFERDCGTGPLSVVSTVDSWTVSAEADAWSVTVD